MDNSQLVIITGANGGIGSAVLQHCLQNSYSCCAIIRDTSKLQKSALDAVDNSDVLLHVFSYDSTAEKHFPLLFNCVHSVTLVLCAFQIAPLAHIIDLNEKDAAQNIQSNLIQMIQLIIRVARLCSQRKIRLHIVNLDSGAAYRPIDGWGLYSAAKAYIDMFLQTLQTEESCVSVVLYDPGVVDTAMQAAIRGADKSQFSQVEIFRRYFQENQLRSPQAVAANIYARYIQEWRAVDLREKFVQQ